VHQFEWAWIDLARIVLGEHWQSITRDILEARTGKMVFNAYNKSLPVGRMLLEVADTYLRNRAAAASAL
jgi:hypothetical protein